MVGDPNAISAQQVGDLTSAGYTVNRLGGRNRSYTAKEVIDKVGGTHDTALLARGDGFVDAVAAGPLSYAKTLPLAITKTDTLPRATIDALKAAGVTQVIVVGGTSAVSNQVVAQLALNQITLKDRNDGAHRVETATKLAAYEVTNYGFSTTRVNVASDDDNLEGADALSGGPVSGKDNRSLLITRDKAVAGSALTDYLKANTKTSPAPTTTSSVTPARSRTSSSRRWSRRLRTGRLGRPSPTRLWRTCRAWRSRRGWERPAVSTPSR